MKKLALICLPGLHNFIDQLADHFTKKYQVVKAYSNQLDQIYQVIQGADVIWLEWANEMAVQCTRMLRSLNLPKKKIIVRLHSYEALNVNYLKQMDWAVVTDVIFVSEFIKEYVEGIIPAALKNLNVHIIPNPIDPSKFDIDPYKYDTGRFEHRDKVVGLLGHLNNKKGIMNLCHAFYALNMLPGESIRLKLGGTWQDPRYETYFWHFMDHTDLMSLVEQQPVEYGTANEFFKDVDFVLCTSPWESQNMSVMEGMLCGCRPLIHEFPGADFHYCQDTNDWLWLTHDELVKAVWDGSIEPDVYRKYISDRYSFDLIMPKIHEVIG